MEHIGGAEQTKRGRGSKSRGNAAIVWRRRRRRLAEEAVPERVDDGGQVAEEAEHDRDHDVDVAHAAVDEDRQGREDDREDQLDDLLHLDRHVGVGVASSFGVLST